MGIYYAIACKSREEFINPHSFGHGAKASEIGPIFFLAGRVLLVPADDFPSWWCPSIAGRWPDLTLLPSDEVYGVMKDISAEFRAAINAANVTALQHQRTDWVHPLREPIGMAS